MAIQDVNVTIDMLKPSGLVGLGKPLILADKVGSSSIKTYSDLDKVLVDFPKETNAYKYAAAVFGQENRPATLSIATYDSVTAEATVKTAADAVAKYYDSDCFFILTADAELTDQIAVADYVEGKKFKIYATQSTDDESRNAFKQKNYAYTINFFHTKADEKADAALVGECGSQEVGSITWKFKTLTGLTPIDIDGAGLTQIHDDGAIAYVEKQGIPQTSEGILVNGEFIDNIHGKSWVKTNMENNIQAAFVANKKLDFDSSGIAVINSAMTSTLKRAYDQSIIAKDDDGNPIFSVTTLSREEVPAEERVQRKYNGASFSYTASGAIHSADVNGAILF